MRRSRRRARRRGGRRLPRRLRSPRFSSSIPRLDAPEGWPRSSARRKAASAPKRSLRCSSSRADRVGRGGVAASVGAPKRLLRADEVVAVREHRAEVERHPWRRLVGRRAGRRLPRRRSRHAARAVRRGWMRPMDGPARPRGGTQPRLRPCRPSRRALHRVEGLKPAGDRHAAQRPRRGSDLEGASEERRRRGLRRAGRRGRVLSFTGAFGVSAAGAGAAACAASPSAPLAPREPAGTSRPATIRVARRGRGSAGR